MARREILSRRAFFLGTGMPAVWRLLVDTEARGPRGPPGATGATGNDGNTLGKEVLKVQEVLEVHDKRPSSTASLPAVHASFCFCTKPHSGSSRRLDPLGQQST